jgi:RHS repeat-associated protein
MSNRVSWFVQATVLASLVAAGSFLPLGSYATAAKRGSHAHKLQRNGLQIGARELKRKRTTYSSTYRNPDGTMTTSISGAPVNYVDSHHRMQRINSNLVPSRRGYAWRNAANRFHARFRRTTTPGFLRFDVAGRRFSFSLAGTNRDAAGHTRGEHLTYPGIFDGVDLRYTVLPDGLKETLVLGDPLAPSHYRFTMTPAAGARLQAERQRGGSWAIFDAARLEPLFVLDAPSAVDSPDASEHRAPSVGRTQLTVRKVGGHFVIDLTVDRKWLDSPDRSFPVLVDPTLTIQGTSQFGNFDWTCSTCAPTTDDRVFLGTTDTKIYRSALQFALTAIPAGATISDAELRLYYDGMCLNVGTNACVARTQQFDAHRLTAAWSTTSTPSQLQFTSSPVASTTFSTIADADVQWVSWNLTQTVKDWFSGLTPNYGVLMKLNTEPLGASGIRPPSGRFAEPSLKPKLDITYTSDAVTLLPITATHANGTELEWTKYVGETGAPFQKYEVHRSLTSKFTPTSSTLLATIPDVNLTTYHDTTAAPSKTFYYKVVANTSASNEQSATTNADGKATRTIQSVLTVADKSTTITYTPGTTECANLGSDRNLRLEADSTATRRALLYFDLRDIPTTASIIAARLSLWRPYANGFTATVDLHRVTTDWQEGTGTGTCTGDGATWYETEAGVRWAANGGDYDPTPAKSLTTSTAAAWDNYYIEGLVGQWVNGTYPNLGVLLKLHDETPTAGHQFDYYSDDFSVAPSLRPKLYVNYTDGSHAIAPTTSVASPGPSDLVSGSSVNVTAAATDDRRVDKVDFYVDGGATPIASDTTAPFSTTWNTTGVANGSHTLTTKATDDAGNVTTSNGTVVTVDNSAPPATAVTSPAPSSSVTGTPTIAASASDDGGISRVEFYVDDARVADDTTPDPTTGNYTASWPTLDPAQPAYDGSHTVVTKAYSTTGQVTTSSAVTVSTTNTSGTKYIDAASSTAVPLVVTYDPTVPTQEQSGVDVTVTNKSAQTWSAASVFLRYRWISSDATPVYTDGGNVSLGSDLAPGASKTIRMMVTPPTLPDATEKAQYTLRFDLYDNATGTWFAAKGNQPLDNPVIVNKALVREALGLESYYQYVTDDVGAGMKHLVNVANGNSILRWTPLASAGRGLGTQVDLTYNALEKKCACPAGNNWSIGISSLTRLGIPIDIHPNNADTIAGRSNKFIEYTDADGTTHRFTDANSDGYWEAPAGEHYYLRVYSTTDATKKWAFTTPDRVTYFYDSEGYPTSAQDGNGNTLTFTESDVAPADDPGGPKKHVTSVTDAGGRSYTITYWTKADAKKPQVRGKIKRITDHSGHPIDFDYYEDGNLLRITERGGTKADGSFLPDRSFVFTYTTSDGSGPAIPIAADRVNPDPKTPNESTRVFSVRDPRGSETTFSYLGPGYGTDRWKLATETDRGGATTSYAYDTTNRITTVTLPLTRVWKYAYDTEGKATSITNPLSQVTTQAWSPDRQLTKVTEPTGAYTERAYNDNGRVTDQWDQLRNHTAYTYGNFAVDANDVSTKWEAGRTIPHISQLTTETAPNGTATATPTNDYQTSYAYDTKGNPTAVTDPTGAITALTYNADGTLATAKDANGFTTTYSAYDANGMATKTVDAKGGVATRSFDSDGHLLWSQDPLHASDTGSNQREYRTYVDYDSFHRVGRSSSPKSTKYERGSLIWSSVDYDANDNLTLSRAPSDAPSSGAATTQTYDAMDRPLVTTGPNTSIDPAGARSVTQYDLAGRATSYTAPKGVLTTNTSQDYADFITYDGLDRVTREASYEVDGTGAVTRSYFSHYCYDTVGNLVRTTAPAANLATVDCSAAPPAATTLMGYDAAHQQTSSTDPAGNPTSATYDADGNIVSSTDEAGAVTTSSYNQRDELVKEVEPFDRTRTPVRNLTTMYEYDPLGNIKRDISPRAYDASTDKVTFTQYVTTYQYDELGRQVRVDLPTSTSFPQQQYIHTTYDANGNVTSESLPVTTSDPTAVPATKKTTITPFDTGLSRVVKDPANPAVHYDYDPSGQQASRIPEDRSGNLDLSKKMAWTYDVDGQLSTITDAGGQSRSYGYDANGNVTSVNESGITTQGQDPVDVLLTYNGSDQLSKLRQKPKTSANYRFTTYGYDLNGNISAVEDGGTEDPAGTLLTSGRKYEYSYDNTDFVTTVVDRGPTSSAGDDLRVSSAYTPTGFLTSETFQKSNASGVWSLNRGTDYTYFSNGLPKTQTTKNQNGAVLESHTLDYENSSGIYVNGNTSKDTYTLAGPQAGPCQSTACTVTYGYNPREQLVDETQLRNGVTTDTSYTLDTAGNITAVSKNGTTTSSYTYTGDQLTTRTRSGDTQNYWYDDEGNLDCTTSAAGSRGDCNPAVGEPASTNLRADYGYDYLNRMSSYRSYGTGGGTLKRSTAYVYDALGQLNTEQELVRPSGAPQSTLFTYDSSGNVTHEDRKDIGTGATVGTRDYTYGGWQGKTSVTVGAGGQSTTYSYGQDFHGSTSMLIGSDGAAKASYAYNAYGQTDSQLSQGDTNTDDPINSFRYTSKRFDSGSSLLDMGVRHFDTDDAHFVQQDRLNDAQGDLELATGDTSDNRYALAAGNPVGYVEDDGHNARRAEHYKGVKPRYHSFSVPFDPRVGILRGGLFIGACKVLKLGFGDCRTFDTHANPSRYRAFFKLNYKTGRGVMRVNPSCAGAWKVRVCFRPNPISTHIPHVLAWKLRVNRFESGQYLASKLLLTTDLYIKTSLVAATGRIDVFGIPVAKNPVPPPPAISNYWEFQRRPPETTQWIGFTPVDLGYIRDSYPSLEWYQDAGGRTWTICRQKETTIRHLAPPSDDLRGICRNPAGII